MTQEISAPTPIRMDQAQSAAPAPKMLRRLSVLLAGIFGAAALSNTAAQAAGGGGEAEANPLLVELPNLALPVGSGRRLVNYLFFYVRLTAADSQSGAKIRTMPYMARDYIVRASGRNPVRAGSQAGRFDQAALVAMIKSSVEQGMGVRLARVEIQNPRFMRG